MKKILALTWKDLKIFLKDRGGIVLIFVQPFMFNLVISYALSGAFSAAEHPIQILAVNQDAGTQAATLLDRLKEMKAFSVETSWEGHVLTLQEAERLIIQRKRAFAFMNSAEKTVTVARVDPTARKLLVLKGQLVGASGWNQDLIGCWVEAVIKPPEGRCDEFLKKRLEYGNHLQWVYGDWSTELHEVGQMLGLQVEVIA